MMGSSAMENEADLCCDVLGDCNKFVMWRVYSHRKGKDQQREEEEEHPLEFEACLLSVWTAYRAWHTLSMQHP